VPIISARISWLIFGTTVSGLLSLPNWASNNRILANRFSLEIGRLIFLQGEDLLSHPSFREKGLGIESRSAILWLRLRRLETGLWNLA
jgi:hypothetical protein